MRKGPRKFQFSFGGTGLTRYGGLILFRQFCKSLGLKRFLQTYVSWPDYGYREYHPADLFLTHVFAIVAGIGRIENTQPLVYNGLIPPILGLSQFPHRDTLRTFLWRFGSKPLMSLQSAHNKLRCAMMQRIGFRYSAIVDADTTPLTVFGHQENTSVGYNPQYRGKRFYAPLISSEGKSGFSLGMELRAGNVHASTRAWEFLKSQFDKQPSTMATSRIRCRLDGSFYNKDVIFPLDEAQMGFAIVAHQTAPFKRRMTSARYHEWAEGWEAAEFTYPVATWKTEHRCVAIRRPKALEPEELQLRLFTLKNYTYHQALVVGHLPLTPPAIYRFYCDRGFQELLLREFKNAYFMACIPTRSFLANATYMEMVLWAYDLVLAFQYQCLPREFQHLNISTLRRDLWWLPAEWVNRHNRNVLRLPARYPHQALFLKIQKAITHVKPLL